MRNKLIMKYPASWHGDMWREAIPIGNGEIGALVYGGVWKEVISLIHGKLWVGAETPVLPDVSNVLPKMRQFLKENRPVEAEFIMHDELKRLGYTPKISRPMPVCDIEITQHNQSAFTGYRRYLNMENAEAEVCWNDVGSQNSRRFFVSRTKDMACLLMTAVNGNIHADLTLKLHDLETLGNGTVPENVELSGNESFVTFAASADGKDFGAVMKVEHNGIGTYNDGVITISGATCVSAFIKLFVYCDRKIAIDRLRQELTACDYETELTEHTSVHNALFSSQTLSLGGKDHCLSNEELLLRAYDGKAPVELIEKLWSFGRYLLICATRENGYPCQLYGLWTGGYNSMWAFNMFNVNIEMIYWQALPGNMGSALMSVFDYMEAKIDDYRENARKLYGCRGINIPSVSTPESGLHKFLSPHILHWTGAAAWIAQFYYDYYLYTGDNDFLKNRALPFMKEAAAFYEDFLYMGEKGCLEFSPSNSPENTPANIKKMVNRESEVTVNATMDVALVKELLTNLIRGSEKTGMYSRKVGVWRDIINKLPDYRVNRDGAVAEWIDEFYEDNYNHRHLSHLYPVFPGREITIRNNPALYSAFEKAVELRKTVGICDQSGWSLMYMANIFARMGKGDEVNNCIDYLTRSVLLPNFFTVHNDWRRMGIAVCNDIRNAPIQLDANMGLTAAILESLVFSNEDELYIFPALPSLIDHGSAGPIQTRTCSEVSLSWSGKDAQLEIYHKGCDRTVTVILPKDMFFENNQRGSMDVVLVSARRYRYQIRRK